MARASAKKIAPDNVQCEPSARSSTKPINNHLRLRLDDLKTFQPLTDNQKIFFDAYKRGDYFVALHGVAGTGKTLLALAGSLEMRNGFDQLILARPIIPLSNRDIGFLPGDAEEKVSPYMQPLFDNLNFITYYFSDLRNQIWIMSTA